MVAQYGIEGKRELRRFAMNTQPVGTFVREREAEDLLAKQKAIKLLIGRTEAYGVVEIRTRRNSTKQARSDHVG